MRQTVSLSISADVECPKCGAEIDIVIQASENPETAFWDWLKKWIGPQSEEAEFEVDCECGHTFNVNTNNVAW